MDAYSSLIVQMSENRVDDLRRETRRRSAARLARLIRRRPPETATPAPVVLPTARTPAEERRIA